MEVTYYPREPLTTNIIQKYEYDANSTQTVQIHSSIMSYVVMLVSKLNLFQSSSTQFNCRTSQIVVCLFVIFPIVHWLSLNEARSLDPIVTKMNWHEHRFFNRYGLDYRIGYGFDNGNSLHHWYFFKDWYCMDDWYFFYDGDFFDMMMVNCMNFVGNVYFYAGKEKRC